MFDRDQIVLYVVLTAMATWGGIVSYFRKVSNGTVKHTLLRLLVEALGSAFTGLVFGMFLLEQQVSPGLTVALAGVVGHMGGKAMELGEELLRDVLYRLYGTNRRIGDVPGAPRRRRADDLEDDQAPRPPADAS